MNTKQHTRGISFASAALHERPYCSEPVTATNLERNHVTFGGEVDNEELV